MPVVTVPECAACHEPVAGMFTCQLRARTLALTLLILAIRYTVLCCHDALCPCRCVIQDVLDKVLGVCDEAGSKDSKTAADPVDREAVTLEFYSVSYEQDGASVGHNIFIPHRARCHLLHSPASMRCHASWARSCHERW